MLFIFEVREEQGDFQLDHVGGADVTEVLSDTVTAITMRQGPSPGEQEVLVGMASGQRIVFLAAETSDGWRIDPKRSLRLECGPGAVTAIFDAGDGVFGTVAGDQAWLTYREWDPTTATWKWECDDDGCDDDLPFTPVAVCAEGSRATLVAANGRTTTWPEASRRRSSTSRRSSVASTQL